MLTKKDIINAFSKLGEYLSEKDELLEEKIKQAQAHNQWFVEQFVHYSINNWVDCLKQEILEQFSSNYSFKEKPKSVAIVMAGNIPLVGFHDFLCVLLSGNSIKIKASKGDAILPVFLADKLIEFEPKLSERIEFTQQLKNFDAVIATGSNNTARYFDYYFGKYPHIIRKNRNSVAVLSGNETEDELNGLAEDILLYFGLGCRGISKLYVPKNYDLNQVFKALYNWKWVGDHHKYGSSYDYHKAIYLLNKEELLENGFILFKKDTSFSSPVATLFYEEYDSVNDIERELETRKSEIQCIASKIIEKATPLGKTQQPNLTDFADNIDTMNFLSKL